MSLVEWNDKMSVGIETLDNDHRKLIDSLNHLHDAVRNKKDKAVVERVLDELIRYTEYHFDCEERLMKLARYPGLEQHRESHDRLKERVRKIAENFRTQPHARLTREIFDFLSDWLVRHILGEDMKYRDSLSRPARSKP